MTIRPTWSKALALSAVFLSTVGVLEATATPVTSTPTADTAQASATAPLPNPSQLAQANTAAGACRRVNRKVDIFSEASVAPSSVVRATLDTGSRVTLSDSGNNGWVGVSSPVSGYVIARYLYSTSDCGGNPPPPPPTTQSCRKVVAPPEGLIVRSGAGTNYGKVGSVFVGNTLRVTGEAISDADSRRWVQIAQPVSGWVSSGFPEGNLSAPFTCP
ncbi:MAG TPA: SH3 domain-containing protein [Chroococcales cyanobacterium]|jgi:uncharacterized protein YgiM (DUF1202 family)